MRFPLRVLAITAVSAAAACGGSDSGTTSPVNNPNPTPTPTPTPVVTTSVTLGNNFFDPASIQVSPGATVTWTWPSTVVTHNVTFGDGTGSGDKPAGSTFNKTFPSAGTFTYSCTIHPGMNGSVLVK